METTSAQESVGFGIRKEPGLKQGVTGSNGVELLVGRCVEIAFLGAFYTMQVLDATGFLMYRVGGRTPITADSLAAGILSSFDTPPGCGRSRSFRMVRYR
jgi:hypothetical protein